MPEPKQNPTTFNDGDTTFLGVDERDPIQVPPGFANRAKNKRFRNKRAEDRLGIPICPWMRGTDGRTPFTEIYGGCTFSDPVSGVEWILIAADGGVWKTRPQQVASAVALPGGVTLSSSTFKQLVQCMGVIILLRGPDNAPLVCSNLDEGFKAITQTSTGLSANAMPNSSFGRYFLNRLVLIKGRDTMAVSDIGDYTRFPTLTSSFKINEGNNDTLVAISLMDESTLICLKDKSILKVNNFIGDLSEAVGPLNVTDKCGCLAPLSVVKTDSDVYWWGQRGLESVRLTEFNKTKDTDFALTDPMIQTLGRINPLYLSGIVAAEWNGYLFVAVPLDDAEILGPELVASGATYGGGGDYTLSTLDSTARYRYVTGTHDTDVTDTVTDWDYDYIITPAFGTLTFFGGGSQTVTASLRQIKYSGINNGILVYDTQNEAWCGTDEADGVLCIKQFLKVTIDGTIRLLSLNADGLIRLHEEGAEDEIMDTVAYPYIDLLVSSAPPDSSTVQVNGGTTATGSIANATNTVVNSWGISTLANARANLWSSNNRGYDQTLSAAWTAPTVTTEQTDWGVRFISTGAALPTLKINGATISASGYYGIGSWAYVEIVTGTLPSVQAIQSELLTRGYSGHIGDRVNIRPVLETERKKFFTNIEAQLSGWDPKYTIETMTDGVNETKTQIAARTRNRKRYNAITAADWDDTNKNDDQRNKGREDYSIVLDKTGCQAGYNGITPDAMQDFTEAVPNNDRGHYLQLRITNTQGRLDVRGVVLSAQPDQQVFGSTLK